MIIQISGDDGVLYAGVPKLVILTVSENNNQVTFPFPADQAISKIYAAARLALNQPGVGGPAVILNPIAHWADTRGKGMAAAVETAAEKTVAAIIPGKIQKRDLVTYIGSPSEGTEDLKPGHVYRVLDVKKTTAEIVDDESPNPIRLNVPRQDIELKEKAAPLNIVKSQVFEITEKCAACSLEMVLIKEKDGVYRGQCDDVCGHKQEKILEKQSA